MLCLCKNNKPIAASVIIHRKTNNNLLSFQTPDKSNA